MNPTVLICTGFYLPGYKGGGPIRTIANLIESLGDEFNFLVITSDRDLGDIDPYDIVRIDDWNAVGKAKVYYASKKSRSILAFNKLLRETPHDLLYLNSFFDPQFTLKVILAHKLSSLRATPVLIAPRGQFSPGALEIKAAKKRLFIWVMQIFGIFKKVRWHASTELEAGDIMRNVCLDREFVSVARNLVVFDQGNPVVAPLHKPAHRLHSNVLRICFLSRISPKKNLDFALRILKNVRARVEFRIYGPREDALYWEKCMHLISELPANIVVTYGGSVDPAEVIGKIGECDIFFVPTLGENFGHVFSEALSAGVPILVSDKTPWRDLEKNGVGWDLPLTKPELFVRAIENAANFGDVARLDMRRNCLNYAQMKGENSKDLVANRALFRNTIGIEHNVFE